MLASRHQAGAQLYLSKLELSRGILEGRFAAVELDAGPGRAGE